MDRRLIWAIKSSYITPTRKKLDELAAREDLYDCSKIDVKNRKYRKAVKSFETAAKMGYSVVTYLDNEYPARLRGLSLPPPVLYVRGNVAVLNDIVYAGIVGCRKCDSYGRRVAAEIACEIGQTGAGIVSGGAEGVDSAAHLGALRANAPTIAVMGTGLDVIYPAFNKELFDKIEKSGGAIISEFPFGEPPRKRNFPHRNRIIAAMSTAVVVARAGKRSGSLITANQAINMNRTVYAVPGNIGEYLSAGVNGLIRDGAMPLLSAMDVIDELILKEPDFFVREKESIKAEKTVPVIEEEYLPKKQAKGLSEYEAEIVSIIKDGFNTQPLLEEKVSFDGARLTALLSMLEIKDIIKKGADKKYVIK